MRLCAALALAMVTYPALAASPFLVSDLESARQADYLVIAADFLADACAPLLEHRQAGGYRVALVTQSSVTGAGSGPPESAQALAGFVARARQDWGVRFVLLAGDAAGRPGEFIPMVGSASGYYSPRFLSDRDVASDYDYAAGEDGLPGVHIGRLPADNPEELGGMIRRIIDYETSLPAGEWQGKVSFVVGRAGFSEFIDAVLESQFTQILSADLPPAYAVRVLHGNPVSPFCPYPPDFLRETLNLLNAGSLFFVYVGHGQVDELDDVRWSGGLAPILRNRDLDRVRVEKGAPVMAVIACDTAKLDDPSRDSLGEQTLKVAAGPVAYIGSTRVCQPYANALLGRGLVQAAFGGQHATLGEILDAARAAVLQPDASPFRQQADAMAGMIQGPENLAGMRRDVVRHYVLLGDPATVLRLPGELPELAARVQAGELVVSGRSSLRDTPGRASLARSLSAAAGGDRREPASGEEFSARFSKATETVSAQAHGLADADGMFSVTLPVGDDLAPGTWVVRVCFADDRQAEIGAVTLVAPGQRVPVDAAQTAP